MALEAKNSRRVQTLKAHTTTWTQLGFDVDTLIIVPEKKNAQTIPIRTTTTKKAPPPPSPNKNTIFIFFFGWGERERERERERKRDWGHTQREQSSSRVFFSFPMFFVCTQEEAVSQAYTHTHTPHTQTFACAVRNCFVGSIPWWTDIHAHTKTTDKIEREREKRRERVHRIPKYNLLHTMNARQVRIGNHGADA